MLWKFPSRNSLKIFILSALLLLICFYANSQNLIGYNDKAIVKYMKENRSEMNKNSVTNSKFSYLKYSDNSENQTLLFFLNPDSVCKSIRMICDVSMKNEKVKEFNSLYVKSGENRWIEKRGGKVYIIEISDGKWSCVISIESDK